MMYKANVAVWSEIRTKRNLLYISNQLMMYKAKVAVCSEIRTKHSTQSEHHVELLNINP
jgi:hypothetical protein